MSEEFTLYDDILLTLENNEELYKWFLAKKFNVSDDDCSARLRCNNFNNRFYNLGLDTCQKIVDHLKNRWLGMCLPTPPIESIPNTNSEYLKKESIMSVPTSKLTFAQKFVVNGNDVSTLTLPQIYTLIAGEEARIKELEKIVNKPKALTTEIAEANATLKALVEHLDSK